jgi:hypothetical protein
MLGQQGPATFARQLFEHLADVRSTDADLYLAKVIAELFELSPITREHVSDLILVELSEELHRRGNPGRETARMVAEIQRDWMWRS